jgi:hypothetical protein
MSKTNLELLPDLHAKKTAHEANLRDIAGAFRDKVKNLRELKDEATGKSVKDMMEAEKKAIATLTVEMTRCLNFPAQINMDLQQ